MKFLAVLAERCTGTHFAEHAIARNFKIQTIRILGKHFFGHDETVFDNENADETLFVFLTRHPIDWIDSFFKRLHNVPPENKTNIYSFINNGFYSIHEQGEKKNTELMEDRNIITKERYKDIFELRKVKNNYLMNVVEKKVKHFLILKYEDLRDNYDATLDKIGSQFNLERWHPNTQYEKIIKYKGTYNAEYYKKPILISDEVVDQIKERIDIEQERELGYEL